MADRAHYLHKPIYETLNQACVNIAAAFGTPYLVGSALEHANYRDVDVRVILPDREFQDMFHCPSAEASYHFNLRWSIICSLISKSLEHQTGLPIDFQFQSQTEADRYEGARNPLGFFLPELEADQ